MMTTTALSVLVKSLHMIVNMIVTNVTRSVSDAEGDVFSQSDIDAFLDEGVEARNCCL